MRTDSENTPLSRAKECPVTVIRNSRRILGIRITAGTTGHPPQASSARRHGIPSGLPNPSSPGGPAPDHLVSRIWRHSPYCKDSPKYGLMVRENGRWVHKKSREG